VPIDVFGKKCLSKFGWVEGVGLGPKGTTNNAIIQPIEYMPRAAKLGLGAKPPTFD